MLRRVALVKTEVSEELSASFNRITRIGEVGTTLVVSSNRLKHIVFFYGEATHRHLVFLLSVLPLIVTANVAPSSPVLVGLMMEGI
jgi:hypothetical protein